MKRPPGIARRFVAGLAFAAALCLRAALCLQAALVFIAIGCDNAVPASARGPILATVNGKPVSADELMLPESANEADIRAALEQAIDHELLAQEGRARALTIDTLMHRERQISVQHFLREHVEANLSPEDIAQAKVEERYKARASEFNRPVAKASLHVLAKLPPSATPEQERAGKAAAQEAWDAMTDASAAEALLKRYKRKKETAGGVKMIAERVPPISKESSADQAYIDALFQRSELGRVPHLVRTSFGWHAIWISSVRPAIFKPLEEVEAEIRDSLSTEARRALLEEILTSLRASTKVELDKKKLRELLGEQYEKRVQYQDVPNARSTVTP